MTGFKCAICKRNYDWLVVELNCLTTCKCGGGLIDLDENVDPDYVQKLGRSMSGADLGQY